jgi:hypothetical protein
LVASGDGLLWQINVLQALQYYQQLGEGGGDGCCVLDSDIAIDIPIDTSIDAGVGVAPSGVCARLLVDVGAYDTRSGGDAAGLRARDAANRALLPAWLQVAFQSPRSHSRLSGVASVPAAAFQSLPAAALSRLGDERRVFVSDANTGALLLLGLGLRGGGGAGSGGAVSLDLQQAVFGEAARVLLPTALVARVNAAEEVAEIFVAEYLGKLWRVTLPLAALVPPDLAHSRPPASASGLSRAVNTQGSRQR